jgi:hypothetical protein
MVSNSSSSSSSSGGVGVAVAAAGAKSTKKPRHRAHQPHFSELPAVRADGARCDGSGTPGLAPAHISGGAAVEWPELLCNSSNGVQRLSPAPCAFATVFFAVRKKFPLTNTICMF